MKNKVLPIVGALGLGALGSGLWELVKPVFVWASSASLNIVTLGLDSLRDGLYADAASQSLGQASGFTLNLIAGTLTGFFLASLTSMWGKERGRKSPPNDLEADKLEMYKSLVKSEVRVKRLWLSFILILFIPFVFLMTQRVIYIDRAQSHVNRLCLIVAPFIEQNQLAKIRSAFALVESRDDYVKVVSELERVAKGHDVKVPKFTIF